MTNGDSVFAVAESGSGSTSDSKKGSGAPAPTLLWSGLHNRFDGMGVPLAMEKWVTFY